MADPRECAVCGKSITWHEDASGGIVALDRNPLVQGGRYAIIDGLAVWLDSLNEPKQAMLAGPLYADHLATCKPKGERK